jgi:hypothetical protein
LKYSKKCTAEAWILRVERVQKALPYFFSHWRLMSNVLSLFSITPVSLSLQRQPDQLGAAFKKR